ncbi:MBL fold metallo-hydrolase [Nitratifractor sp.]
MKTFVLTLLSSLFVLAGNLYTFTPVKIADGIECVIGDFNPPSKANKGFVNNACAVDQGDGIVVVEGGPSYRFAKEYAAFVQQRMHKPIKALVVTNYHDDRLFGASYYREKSIPIYAHRSIVDDIHKNPEKFERLKHILTPEEFAGTKLVVPDRLFDRNITIPGKRHTLELLKLSPVSEEASDLVVWVPDAKFLFAGNIVFNNRMLNYTKNSNMKGWIQALEKIAAMHPAIVLGGHGATMGPDAYQTTLAYLKSLRKQVKKAYDNDVDNAELMKHLDLKAFDKLGHSSQLNPHNARNYYEQLEWEE